ncbi:hypothetical protein [Stenotrophomonas phage RAS14]
MTTNFSANLVAIIHSLASKKDYASILKYKHFIFYGEILDNIFITDSPECTAQEDTDC